jgi:hypothetical protein
VRHATDDHRQRGLNRVARRRRIGAQVLTDRLDLIGAEMLLDDVEERHEILQLARDDPAAVSATHAPDRFVVILPLESRAVNRL